MSHRHGHDHPARTPDGAHHHASTDVDWAAMAAQLEAAGELRLGVLGDVAADLRARVGAGARRVLDVGSGPGVMTCLLAQTFPGADAVAVDATPALLDAALARADRLGLGGRVSTRAATLPDDLAVLAELAPADVVWASATVHHLGDQQGALDALAGLLREGGVLAVAEGGLPLRFAPRDLGIGRPGLQGRLDVVEEGWFEQMRSELPGSVAVVEDWPAMLRRAGLVDVAARSYLLDLPAPLDDAARGHLHRHLTRVRDAMGDALAADDLATLDALVDRDSAAGVLRRPDVFLLQAVTVVSGHRPGGPAARA